jgi:diguanylate cyclase (GGDEF)-like protein
MARRDLLFRSGLTRVVVGSLALVLLYAFYPSFRDRAWVLVAYLAFACGEQVLIWKDIGGRTRSLIAGLVDVAIITYFVHRQGSVRSVMPALYLLAAILNVLVVGRRVGIAIAIVQAVAFNAVVWSEHFGIIGTAPDVPEIAALGPPPLAPCAMSSVLVTVLLAGATMTVGQLTAAIAQRERELSRTNKMLDELSRRDPLTNLVNRREIFGLLEERLEAKDKVSVVMVDLDGFKKVNDTHGHHRGDMVLVEVAQALQQAVRESDVVGRYGGDEFMIVLPRTERSEATGVATRVVSAVEATGKKLDSSVTASVGIAESEDGDSVASLTRRADEKAYAAKKSGGNRYVA